MRPRLDITGLPPRARRQAQANALKAQGFDVSPRTLERWPVTVIKVNKKALLDTAETFAHAQKMLDAAPIVRGGRSGAA
jgi:hypothetical protein